MYYTPMSNTTHYLYPTNDKASKTSNPITFEVTGDDEVKMTISKAKVIGGMLYPEDSGVYSKASARFHYRQWLDRGWTPEPQYDVRCCECGTRVGVTSCEVTASSMAVCDNCVCSDSPE